MKRRNFLKMLPVGLLAAKFGGLVELLPVKLKKLSDWTAVTDGAFKVTVDGVPVDVLLDFSGVDNYV